MIDNELITESKVKESYDILLKAIRNIDAVKFLSQYSMTFLTQFEGKELNSQEAGEYIRNSEFLFGLLLSKARKPNDDRLVDGAGLDEINDATTRYLMDSSMYSLYKSVQTERTLELGLLGSSYMLVSGEMYSHKYKNYSLSYYRQFDKILKNELGFSVDELIHIFESICSLTKEKLNDHDRVKKNAIDYLNSLPNVDSISKTSYDKLLQKSEIYEIFVNSDYNYIFDLESIVSLSGLSKRTCLAFLKRFSQEFGYSNDFQPSDYRDHTTASLSYNTISERPIVLLEDNLYWFPLQNIWYEVAFNSLHYDLLNIDQVENYGNLRGKWVEEFVARKLSTVFPQSSIFVNPCKTDSYNEELCDVLVLYSNNIYIFQCKSKDLLLDSRRGSKSSLRNDMIKGVISASNQSNIAKSYLSNHGVITFWNKDDHKRICIDTSHTYKIYTLNIILGSYSTLFTQYNRKAHALGYNEVDNELLNFSISDFDIITDAIRSPALFNHYLNKRIEIENLSMEVMGDEIDLLSYYLNSGMTIEDQENIDSLMITDLSTDFDQMYSEDGRIIKTIEEIYPSNVPFWNLIDSIEGSGITNSINIAACLLDLSPQKREVLLESIENCNINAEKDYKTFRMVIKEEDYLIVYLVGEFTNDIKALFETALNFAILEKFRHDKYRVAVIAKDLSTKNLIDTGNLIEWDNSLQDDIRESISEYL